MTEIVKQQLDFFQSFGDDNILELILHLTGKSFSHLECASSELLMRLRPLTKKFYRTLCLPYLWFLGDNPTWNGQQWLLHYLHISSNTSHSHLLVLGGSTNRQPGGGHNHDDDDDEEEQLQWLNSCENIPYSNGDAVYNAQHDLCTTPTMNLPRDACAVTRCPHTHTLWVSGGWNGEESHRSIEYLTSNQGQNSWSMSNHSLIEQRCFHASVFDNKYGLLVLGGSNHLFQGAVVSNTIEMPMRHQMFPFSMLHKRTGHIGSLNPLTRQLIVCGGYGGGAIYHDTVEMIDLSHPQGFVALPTMTTKKTGAGGGFGPDGCMYVCGGSTNGTDGLDVLECLDVREQKWQTKASMHIKRGYTNAAFGIDGSLYCGGGSVLQPRIVMDATGNPVVIGNEQVTYSSIERYDVRMNEWEMMASEKELSVERADHCLISRLLVGGSVTSGLRSRENPVVDVWQSRAKTEL